MRTFFAATATSWGLLMSLAPLLQVRVVIRRRSSAGVSTAWIVVLLVGFVLWLCYGVATDDWPLVITNSVSLTVAGVTLAVLVIHRPRAEGLNAAGSGELPWPTICAEMNRGRPHGITAHHAYVIGRPALRARRLCGGQAGVLARRRRCHGTAMVAGTRRHARHAVRRPLHLAPAPGRPEGRQARSYPGQDPD